MSSLATGGQADKSKTSVGFHWQIYLHILIDELEQILGDVTTEI